MKSKCAFPVLILSALLASVIDSRAQAVRIADLNPGPTGSFPSNMTALANTLYFGAYTTPTGFELYSYDGSTIRLAADVDTTSDDIGGGTMEGNGSIPSYLTVYNNALYFAAYEPRRGAELWKYDGANASRVADISPDNNDTIKVFPNSSWPYALTVFNNKLYFVANSGTISTNYELWVHDGATTTRAANIHPDGPGDQSSYPSGLTVFNGALYFMANDGVNGYELWKHDGVTATMLANINPGGPESSSYPKYFTAFGNHLYFQAYTSAGGFELWKTDGQTVSRAADIAPGAASSSPNQFIVYNNALYFMADDGARGYELWRYDGTNASLAQDINPGGSAYPKNFVLHDGLLYFAADDGVHGWELWKFDGSAATLVSDIQAGGSAFPEELKVLNGQLYFIAESAETGREVWTLRSGMPVLAADVNPGAGSSYPQFLTAHNGGVFFRAAGDGMNDFEMWMLSASVNTPPTVTLAAPEANATFTTTDSIALTAVASDDTAISRVELYANGQLLKTFTTAPYSLTTNFPAGSYSLTAKAFDESGLATTSSAVPITVSAPPNSPPTVTLTTPGANATYRASEAVLLTAEATDDSAVARVEFYVNGQLAGTVSAAPYTLTTNFPAGTHSLTAKAYDEAGLTATSTAVTITVVAAADPVAPSITGIERLDNEVRISVAGSAGVAHDLQTSTDLANWQTVATVTPDSANFSFTQPIGSEPRRFFRVVARP